MHVVCAINVNADNLIGLDPERENMCAFVMCLKIFFLYCDKYYRRYQMILELECTFMSRIKERFLYHYFMA